MSTPRTEAIEQIADEAAHEYPTPDEASHLDLKEIILSAIDKAKEPKNKIIATLQKTCEEYEARLRVTEPLVRSDFPWLENKEAHRRRASCAAQPQKKLSSTVLLPCPFCGGTNAQVTTPHGGQPQHCVVICTPDVGVRWCGASSAWKHTEAEARQAWNARA